MIKKKTKGKTKKKKTYDIDGFCFRTKPIYNFYLELKEAQSKKIIKDFELPDIKTTACSKFGAQKCTINGYKFDSVMEGRFYFYLVQEKKAGRVKKIELQPEYVLQESFKKNGKTIRAIKYRSDFLVTYEDGTQTLYDVKGKKTADFALKQKMFDNHYRDLELVCIKYTEKEGWHVV